MAAIWFITNEYSRRSNVLVLIPKHSLFRYIKWFASFIKFFRKHENKKIHGTQILIKKILPKIEVCRAKFKWKLTRRKFDCPRWLILMYRSSFWRAKQVKPWNWCLRVGHSKDRLIEQDSQKPIVSEKRRENSRVSPSSTYLRPSEITFIYRYSWDVE